VIQELSVGLKQLTLFKHLDPVLHAEMLEDNKADESWAQIL